MEEGVWVPKTPAKSILARWGPVSVDGNWKNHVSGSFSTGTSHDSAEFNAMSSADSMDAAQALKERIANEFDLNKSPCELGFGDSSNGDCEDILAGKQGIENHDLQTRNRKCIDLGYLKGINGTEAHLGGMAESSGLMSSENSSRGVNSCGTILACLDKICFTELLSLPVETLPAFETCATPWGGVGRMPGDGVCPTSYSKNDSSMNIPLATSSFAEFGNCVERKDNTEIYGFHGLNQDKHEDDDLFAINKDGNEKFRPSVRSASTGFSTPSKKGNARYNDDVNLNKQSRTKRKRYWPKVAVEGKLKKTPKPSTPKPSTPKPRTPKPPKHATCKKGSVEKRKYVRKNNLKGSTKPSKDIGVDRQTFDASTGCVLESGTPALNSTFFLENHECEYVQNNRITASARRALKFNGKDAGIIIHQYQRRKKKKDSSSHDTNSIVQQSKEDNESMVENSADMAFGFTQSKKWNKTTYMEERGATNDGTNQTGCHYNSMKVYRRIFQCLSNSRKLGPNFPKICKQRRMRRLKTTNFASFGNTAMYGTLQSIIAAEDGQRILKKRRLRRRKATKFGTWWSVRAAENEQTWVQPNNVSSTPIDRQLAPQFSVKNLPVGIESCDIKFLFTIANCNFVVPNYSGIMISPTIAQRLKAVNDPDSFKCVLSLTPFATTTKKRSNESTRRLNLGYTTLIPSCNQLPSAPCTQAFNGRVWNQAVLLADNKNMVTKTQFKMGLFLDNAVYGHNKMEGSPKDVLSTQKSIQDEYSLAFTDVIERLEGLHISNEHGQLIVYNQNAYGTDGGHGPVIPYNPKKRKPPPKVDIDQETMRVWKLLMENGGEDVEGEKAEDKEKWWEEQREVFRGRVDSFIARMHLIQGDRRFLPWKGSVVDSVVGVFLTQNVSDHLSSSAFMSLTAKYPLRPTTNHKACDEDEEIACSQESVGSSIGAVEQTLDANSNGSLVSETKLDLGHQLVENNVTTAGREISDEAEDRTVVKNEFSPHNFVDSVIDGNPTSTSQLSTQTLDANSNGSLVSETKLDLGHQLVENNVTTAGREISDEAEDRTVVKDEFSPHDFVDSVIDGNPTSTSQLSTIEVFSGITEIVQLEETACLLNFSSCENGNLLFNESLVDCDLSRKLENEKQGASPNILFDANDTHAHVCSSSSQNPYSYIPLTPADLEADSLEILAKSTNTKTKDVGDIRKIIGCVESSGSETIVRQKATPRAQEATVDQCASLSKCQVLPECSSQTEVNRAKGRLSSKNHHGGSKIIPQTETPSKRKKSKFEEKQDNPINWDDLRKTYRAKETTTNTMDSLDWEEVRQATVDEVADAIKGRGQHRVLAGRIKEFLDRVVRDHGSLNLEWLRDVPPDKAKDYLLSFKGLGLKSVECVRLLSLHHHAFPVDVNVGRVAVRLGWVPLQPLPESLQIHLLEQYPLLDTIQVYLWPRLCTLDQRTLYELHYQMITFGKVFCRKRNPNCNACPMKGECRHFASAFASARLALPGPQEKSMVSSMFPGAAVQNSTMVITPVTESLPEATFSESRYQTKNWKPIIEHPPSPVPDSAENLERDIEDFYYDEHPPSPVPDSAENLERDIEDFYYESEDDIPTVRLDTEEFKEKLREFIYKSDILLEEGEMSNALVALTSEAASMSVPKLKQVSRLRTVHHVYELPDSHIILKELEKREPDDPSPYLLAIWNSGETSNSSKSPRKQCDSLGSEPCNEYTCSSCNNSQDFQTVSGTILIPCRTATRGSFPLNGTYFQVNEVFADYESSEHPLVIPRSWIWNLRRRTLYCGAYGSAIFRGLSMQEIQSCFWRGFVCVRAFNRKTRAPAHLAHRFHISTVIPKGKRKFTEDQ